MSELTFKLSSEYIELSKLLKACGFCESGGEAKHAILESQVKVNGVIETRKGCKIRTGARVEYQGRVIIVS